jgi:hypothetical protein
MNKNKEKLNHCWYDMIRRCYNTKSKNYKHYGLRGIQVCDEWKNSFKNFYDWAIENGFEAEKYGRGKGKYSLDRINNNGNYEPSNCKFSSMRNQNINKRINDKNTSGFIGISKHSECDFWYGRVKDETGRALYTGRARNILLAVKMRNDFIIKNKMDNKLNDLSGYKDEDFIEFPKVQKERKDYVRKDTVYLNYDGKTLRLKDWIKEKICIDNNITLSCLSKRKSEGWTDERCLITPRRILIKKVY